MTGVYERVGSAARAHSMGRWWNGWSIRDWVVAGLVVLVALASIGAQVVVHRHAGQAGQVDRSITDVRLAVMTAYDDAAELGPEPSTGAIAPGGRVETSGLVTDGGSGEPRSPGGDLASARRVLMTELAPLLTPAEAARLDRVLDGFAAALSTVETTARVSAGASLASAIEQLGASQLAVFQLLEQIELAHLSAVDDERTRLLVILTILTATAAAAVVALTSAFTRARSRSASLAASQSALARSEERFRSLVQHSSDVIAIYDRAGVVRYLSDSFERVLGRPVEAWVGRSSGDLCHPDDLAAAAAAFAGAIAEPGTPRQVELRLRHADGSWRWFEVIGQAGADPAVVDGVVVNARDITDRKALEEQRSTSERRYRSLVEQTPAVTYISEDLGDDPVGWRYVWVSPQIEAITGYTPEAWLAANPLSVVHPEDRHTLEATDAEREARAGQFEGEYRILTPDGREVWVFDSCTRLGVNAAGEATWQGIFLDITQERRTRRELEAATERFRALVEHTPAVTYIVEDVPGGTPAWRYVFVSPQILATTGYSPEEWLMVDPLAVVHPDDLPRFLAANREAERTHHFECEYRVLGLDGAEVWVYDSSRRLRVDERGIGQWQGVFLDTSEVKRVQSQLGAATERFRTLVEQLPGVVYELAVDPRNPGARRFTYVSPAVERLYQLTPEDLTTGDRLGNVHPDDRATIDAAFAVALVDHQPFGLDFRAYTADGRLLWINDQKRFLSRDAAGVETWQGLLTDITAARATTDLMREAEQRYRTLVEQIPAIVYELEVDPTDPNGRRFTYLSPAFERLYEVAPERLMAEPALRSQLVHPEDRALVNAVMAEALVDHAPVSVDFRALTASGKVRWVNDQRRFLSGNPDGTETWQGLITDVSASHDATESLREAERRYRTLVEEVPVVTYRLAIHTVEREDRHYKYLSPQFEHMTGHSVEAWMADKTMWDRSVHPDDYDRIVTGHIEESNVRGWFDITYRMRTATGVWFWCREVARRVGIDPDGYALWQGVWMDVTAQKEAELASRDREEEFRLLFSSNPQPTWVYDRETHAFLEVNTAASALYGYDRDAFLTMRVEQLHAAGQSAAARGAGTDRPTASGGRHVQHVTSEGRLIEVEMTSEELCFRGRPARLVIALDVTARHALEARLVHQAYHDTLTGLPNRALFSDRLQVALTKERPVAVLFVDLDDFKVINDTLGHEVGDALLLAVGERLLGALRPQDTIARLGGDEFTVLLENADLATAIRVADRLIEGLSGSFQLEGHDVVVSPSIGIARNTEGDEEPEELLRRADVAMYEAKTSGKRRHAIFEARMDALAWQRLELESELRRAIAGDQLTLAYQPIVELATGEVTEVEALVRWHHPVRGMLPPGEFIGIAEQSGLILELDAWVLNAAARQMTRWIAEGALPESVSIAVNLSARQFQGRSLVGDVGAALARTGLPASRLKLEITETVALSDIPSTLVMLRELKELGVLLAIDDFGSGYSGLSYLQRCPIDTVKIDRSYVDDIGVHPGDTAMIRAVMAFARTLGLKVTAEGVETEVQLAELRALSVDFAQGYYFARPLAPEAVVELVRERTMAVSLVGSG